MSYQPQLRVLQLALDNTRTIRRLIRSTPNFGDLHNQLARAALSVVSNIEEGDGQTTDRAKRYHFGRARGSNKELQVQLQVLLDEDPQHPIHDAADHVGRMLTRLIHQLE